MPTNILMPALSPTMQNGNLARSLKNNVAEIEVFAEGNTVCYR